jgi:predicted acetyltransferase
MTTAFLGTQVVGSLNVIPLGQWYGGRSVPMGGVATVVVRPEHRGEGIAARLLAHALERMRNEGIVVSTLHPATTRVYRASGWEIGGDLAKHTISTRALERLPRGESEQVRRLGREDWPVVRQCYDAVAPAHPGWIDRSDWWWDVTLDDTFSDQSFLYGVEADDGFAGFVSFVQSASPDGGYSLAVEEMVTRDPGTAVTLWRFLAGHGMQARTVTINRGPVDELLLMLPEQDVRQVHNNRWMHRLVDVPAALAARGYPAAVAAEVHLEVTDKVAPWNDGRWVLRVEGGRGEVTPGGTGEVQLTINGLSALASGWTSATALTGAGALHHASPTACAALDAIFAGPAPTMVDEF